MGWLEERDGILLLQGGVMVRCYVGRGVEGQTCHSGWVLRRVAVIINNQDLGMMPQRTESKVLQEEDWLQAGSKAGVGCLDIQNMVARAFHRCPFALMSHSPTQAVWSNQTLHVSPCGIFYPPIVHTASISAEHFSRHLG